MEDKREASFDPSGIPSDAGNSYSPNERDKDYDKKIGELVARADESLRTTEKLQDDLKAQKDEMVQHRALILFGFLVLLVMVAAIVVDVTLSLRDKTTTPIIYEVRTR
jgi:hypothetical protein